MSTISSQSSFPLLLATCFWGELHGMIQVSMFLVLIAEFLMHTQDYIVEHWEEVSRSKEFEACCQEVAAGE